MIKNYVSKINKIYEDIRNDENSKLLQRKAFIEKNYPEIMEVEKEIAESCIKLSMSILQKSKDREDNLKKIKNRITDLRMRKGEMLAQRGFSTDFLEPHYKCNKCKDTGYIGNKKCSCYNKYLVKVFYESSDLKEILMENNFDRFNFDLFSSEKGEGEIQSPRKNMENIVSKCQNFIDNFNSSRENLLFYGNAGTGKTFLSHCIAKELLDKGSLVVYRTAEGLFKDLKSIEFEGNSDLESLIYGCELLIIDDLGTEQISSFTRTEFFNLINKKLLKHKKMIVSTNLTLEELSRTYSDRISSRLMGNFNLCKFYGDDVRVKLNLKNIRNGL